MSKTYANKSNARRAAKAAGLDVTTLSFYQNEDSSWSWNTAQEEANASPAWFQEGFDSEAAWLAANNPAPKPPRYKLHFRKPAKVAVEQPATPVAAPVTQATALPPAKTFEVYGRSSVLSPVAMVHSYLDKLVAEGVEPKRKDALYALSQMGVNRFTARTQYQRWSAKRAGK